jgi:hypothetical protein
MSLRQQTDFQPRRSFSFIDRSLELPAAQPLNFDFTNRPILAAVYKASGLAIAILGPTFWAALIALFLVAELSSN